jgi:hypothetical protein
VCCAAALVARRQGAWHPGWPDTCPPSRTGGTASCASRAQQNHTACAHGAKLLNHALLMRAAPRGLARAATVTTHPLAVSREPHLVAPGVDAHMTSAAPRAPPNDTITIVQEKCGQCAHDNTGVAAAATRQGIEAWLRRRRPHTCSIAPAGPARTRRAPASQAHTSDSL